MKANPEISLDLCLKVAYESMALEAQAILSAAERLNRGLLRSVEIILAHPSKIIVTGVGKSGQIGTKLASTLCSTGTQAIFLNPSEAVHGDLGIFTPGDPTIMISKSGTTLELMRLLPLLREFKSPAIAILGNLNSPLARKVDVVLDARVEKEADPLNLAPTASSTVALAIGDALAAALMVARGFDAQDYARFHPGGQLGKNLWMHVGDVMHPDEQIALADPNEMLKSVVIRMTRHPLGAACVVDPESRLLGIITDGDIRRILHAEGNIYELTAGEVMTPNPITIAADASLRTAIDRMENRPSQIYVLPVVDDDQRCLGLVRLHDIYQADLRD